MRSRLFIADPFHYYGFLRRHIHNTERDVRHVICKASLCADGVLVPISAISVENVCSLIHIHPSTTRKKDVGSCPRGLEDVLRMARRWRGRGQVIAVLCAQDIFTFATDREGMGDCLYHSAGREEGLTAEEQKVVQKAVKRKYALNVTQECERRVREGSKYHSHSFPYSHSSHPL